MRRSARLRIAEYRNGIRIVAAELVGIDVELDHFRAGRREHPVVGDLPAGVAADEEHEIGFGERAIGAVARIRARHADRQRMRIDASPPWR